MHTNTNRQEILILTNTSFSCRAWSKINERETDNNLSKKEQLMEACWNGLTPDLLPECFEKNYDRSIILWEINDANAFINLEFGAFMQGKENEYSVNPYVFMQVQGYN
jgi:hypothetical protein